MKRASGLSGLLVVGLLGACSGSYGDPDARPSRSTRRQVSRRKQSPGRRAPDGAVEADNGTMAAYSCLAESDAMLPEVGPGQTVVGKIAFDTAHTAHTSGVLVYRPWWAVPAGGWEWEF